VRHRTIAGMADRYDYMHESNELNDWKSAAIVIQEPLTA
jgi:hypothetical protein